MKTVFSKRSTWCLVLCVVMALTLCVAMVFPVAFAEENEPFVARTLYYVDAGNLVDGNGQKVDRGSWGGSSNVVTPTMTERGYAYATQPDDATKLYNSVTDQLLNADAASGKMWGFAMYEGHDWWRHGLTGSAVDGFDSVRLIEAADTATLKYTFEVDDDTTFLKINLGTRMVNGWQSSTFSIKINGQDKGFVTGGETEDIHTFYTKGVLDTESNKYFVTIEMGNGAGQTVYCNTLEVMTADESTEGLEATPYNFVKKGESPRLYKWDGTFVQTTISAEDQQLIDDAEYFTNVTVDCSYGESTFSDVAVTVLPATLEYFLDVGGSGDGKLMIADKVYAEGEDKDCGVDSTAGGTAGWQAFTYDQSCRYDVNWNAMKFNFDVDAGAYGVIVGTYHFDNSTTARTSYLQINSDPYVEVNATYDVASTTSADTIMTESGTMVCSFTANWNYTAQDKLNYPLVTYIAVYRKEAVQFDTMGGSAIAPIFFEVGETVDLSEITASKDNYTFEGWMDGDSIVTSVSESKTLTAKFTPVNYTVTFETNDGSAVQSQSVPFDTTATKPADPTREGYTFAGWYADEKLTKEFDFSTAITGDTTVYAKWDIIKYTVTFNSNQGSSVDAQTVDYGSKATKPADPTRQGYTFAGWYADEGLTTEFDFSAVITGDATVYAKWNINKYTVTFETNDGSEVASQTVEHGSKATKPADPTREGYTFTGWFLDEQLTQAVDFNSAISGNATFYAGWEKNTSAGLIAGIIIACVVAVAIVVAVVVVIKKKKA